MSLQDFYNAAAVRDFATMTDEQLGTRQQLYRDLLGNEPSTTPKNTATHITWQGDHWRQRIGLISEELSRRKKQY